VFDKYVSAHFSVTDWYDEELEYWKQCVFVFGKDFRVVSMLLGSSKSPTRAKELFYETRLKYFETEADNAEKGNHKRDGLPVLSKKHIALYKKK